MASTGDYHSQDRQGERGGGSNNYSHLPYGKRPQAILDAKSPCPKITRQTVDFNSSLVRHVHTRPLHRNPLDEPVLQPNSEYEREVPPTPFVVDYNSSYAVSTRYAEYAKNKDATVINCVRWTPQGRRVVLGCHSGELLLWNGFFFNFELRTQCHKAPVRSMQWSHSGAWLISSDEAGVVQYVEPSLNVVQQIQLRPDAVRSLGFSPDDTKFAAACDDGTLSILDFATCAVEKSLNPHGSDVKALSWHPQQALVATAGKDKAIALVDPRAGSAILTIHGAHRLPITDLKWAPNSSDSNGYIFASTSRDASAKIWDVRALRPLSILRGHQKDVNVVEWHPQAGSILATASNDGDIIYWCSKSGQALAEISGAHDMPIWDLNFHPMGHMLASGSSDQTAKFWAQHLPGDPMQDKYNANHTMNSSQSTSATSHGAYQQNSNQQNNQATSYQSSQSNYSNLGSNPNAPGSSLNNPSHARRQTRPGPGNVPGSGPGLGPGAGTGAGPSQIGSSQPTPYGSSTQPNLPGSKPAFTQREPFAGQSHQQPPYNQRPWSGAPQNPQNPHSASGPAHGQPSFSQRAPPSNAPSTNFTNYPPRDSRDFHRDNRDNRDTNRPAGGSYRNNSH